MAVSIGSGETWNYYHPVNSTVYSPDNIIRLRIPKSNIICDLSRAFIRVRTNLPFSYSVGNDTDAPVTKTPTAGYGALACLHAGCVFDIIDLQINGQRLYHDDFNQSSCRLSMFNKSDEFLRAYPQTYFDPYNRDAVFASSQMAYSKIKLPAHYTANSKLMAQKELIIPLSAIFPCFETLNDWPSFAINDTLEFNLYVSKLHKYMVRAITNASDANGHFTIKPITMDDPLTIAYTSAENAIYYPSEFTIDDVCMYVPVHNPSADEMTQVESMLNDAVGMPYSFRHWSTVSYLSRYKDPNENVFTQQLNYNITTNNMFGVAMIALQPNTEVVFEKPQISTMQVNLGSWELASNGTHIYDNYNYGSDLLRNILDNFSQSNLKYYQTINKAVIYDHSITESQASAAATYRPTGSYFTYYDASPYDELGVAADEFSNLLTYKYTVSNPIYANENLTNAKTYCAVQTLSTLVIDAAGVRCFNPNSKQLTTSSINSLYDLGDKYDFRGPHGITLGAVAGAVGLIPKIISTVVTIGKKIGEGIRNLAERVKLRRSKRHMDWISARLTPEELKANYDQLLGESYFIFPSVWKKTYRKIIAARGGEAAHGAFITRHGVVDNSYPILMPGHRFNPNSHFRLRLLPYSRFFHIAPRRTVPKLAHGLTGCYHGIGSWFKRLFHSFGSTISHVLPEVKRPTMETGKNIIHAFLTGKLTYEEAKEAGKQLLKSTGTNILTELLRASMNNFSKASSLTKHGLPDRKRILYSVFKRSPNIHINRFMKTGISHGYIDIRKDMSKWFSHDPTPDTIYPKRMPSFA